MSGKRQDELPQKIPGSKNNNKEQKINNDEDKPASDPDIPRSDHKDESASDSDSSSDNEEESASDLDSSSEEEENFNGQDGDGDVETGQEERNRRKIECLTLGIDYELANEVRSHTFEDEDGRIEFDTISIHHYNKAKKKLTKLIEILESKPLDEPETAKKEKIRKAKKELADLEEIGQHDYKGSCGGFMFYSESSNFSLNQKIKERFERVILHSGCAFLPSPEVCKSEHHEGSDDTGTLLDFQNVFKWAQNHKLCEKEKCYEIGSEMVDEQSYNDLIKFAFNTGYEVIRDTLNPTKKELMFYYYAGHGVDKKKVEKRYSAAPVLEQNHVFQENYFNDASPYIGKSREVKGGELFLHKFGFCDFEGLVEPFIAAIKSKPNNSSDEKKNKHLIIVLDSCHSGQFAEDLTKFKEKQCQGWLNEGCSVTVQASCGKDETVVGGYFTPTFMFLNDPKNKSVLKKLLGDWDKMKEEEKKKCRDQLPFSSPVVSSTRHLPDSPILQEWVLIEDQDFHITLFQDAGFFKYCHCEIFGPLELEKTSKLGICRELTSKTGRSFLLKKDFKVIDFKLKTFQGRQKFGLFLLKDPSASNRAICAHVHFAEGGTSKVGRINLVHHRYEPNSLPQLDYEREDIGLSGIVAKIPVAMVPNCASPKLRKHNNWVAWKWGKMNLEQSFIDLAKAELSSGFGVTHHMQREVACAMELVTKCHQFVVDKELEDKQVLWSDPKQWNQGPRDPSYLSLFREKQRSLLMEKYYDQIKGYNLPIVQ